MSTETTRQLKSPLTLSNLTTDIIRHFPSAFLKGLSQENSSDHENVPDIQGLLDIKQSLEIVLSTTEDRLRDLQNSALLIDEANLINGHETSNITKTNEGKTSIKIETESISEMLHDLPRSDQSRQIALETLTRDNQKEEARSPDIAIRRSESPFQSVKLRKSDNNSCLSTRSTSPNSKPRQDSDPKKIKKPSSREASKHSRNQNKQSLEEVDFVRVKPKDQIPITTFWSALEPYFRNLTEEDRDFLLQKSDQGKPYLIPPLGQHYLEKWAEEDQEIYIRPSTSNEQKLKYITNPHDISDSQLLKNDLGSGTLTERLISSLVMEDIITDDINFQEEQGGEDDIITSDIEKKYHAKTISQSSPTDQIIGFEERLKRELCYVGLFGDEDIDWNAKEDDEICAELRSLGREFKEQVQQNDFHKRRLLSVVDCQLQYEQYRQVLDTLDSQVEQGYLKRFRPQKAKKRKTTGPKAVLSENTIYAMEKRKTWINALGRIFKDKNMNMPETSIYDDNDQSIL